MRTRCCNCDKDAKIVMVPHQQTGLMVSFVDTTCGHPECLREYERGLEIGYELAKEELEEVYFEEEGVLNE